MTQVLHDTAPAPAGMAAPSTFALGDDALGSPGPYAAAVMREDQHRIALEFVVGWLGGKPTPQGWIIGHGTREVRDVCRKALGK